MPAGVQRCFTNTGQSCNAPTRMLVSAQIEHAAALEVAKAAAEDDARRRSASTDGTTIGPLVSKAQFDKVQRLIQSAASTEGATLVTGGAGPSRRASSAAISCSPTVFADVRNDMTIAREEIFGPVLSILPYDNEEEAIAIANDTPYGLSGYVSVGRSRARAAGRARRSAPATCT